MNSVVLQGYIFKEPKTLVTSSGKTKSSFTLLVDQRFVDRDGNWKSNKDYISCEVWGYVAEKIGSMDSFDLPVLVQGKIKNSSWEGKDGNMQYRTFVNCDRVSFLKPNDYKKKQEAKKHNPSDLGPEPSFDTDEELPF